MKAPKKIAQRLSALLSILSVLASSSLLLAQSTSAPTPSTRADELGGGGDEKVSLDPFLVKTNKAEGYYSEDTLSGARYAKSVMNVAGAIQIVNRQLMDDLDDLGSIHESLFYGISGLSQQRRDSDSFQVRGITTKDTFRNNVVSPVGGSSMGSYDLERIEVIKGPASMVTGFNSSAIGGIINLITRQPTETFRGDVRIGMGDHDKRSIAVDLSGPLWNSPGRGPKVLYRLTGADFYDNIGPAIDSHHAQFYSAGFKVIFSPKTALSLYGYYEYLDRKISFSLLDPVQALAGRAVIANIPAGLSGSLSKDQVRDEFTHMATSELTHAFTKNLALRWSYALGRDHPNTGRRITLYSYNPVTQLAGRNFNAVNQMLTTHQSQVDLVYKYKTGILSHESSIGGDFLSQQTFQYYQLKAIAAPPINVFAPDYSGDAAFMAQAIINNDKKPFVGQSDSTDKRVSEYVQHNISMWNERLIFVGGLRWLQPESKSLALASNATTRTSGPDKSVYKYGAVYKPIDGVSMYYTKMTNFVSLGGLINTGTTYEKYLPDSYGEDEEGGFKFRLLNGHLYGDVDYFVLKLTNQKRNTSIVEAGETIKEAADIKVEGWELHLGSRVSFKMGDVDLMFNYSDAAGVDATGAQIVDTSTYIHSIMSKWTFTTGPLKGFSIGGGTRGQSAKFESGLSFDIPDTADAFASYKFRRFSIQLNVANLTNKRFPISIAGGFTRTPIVQGSLETSYGTRLSLTTKYAF